MKYIKFNKRIYAYNERNGLTFYFDNDILEWKISKIHFHTIENSDDRTIHQLTESEVLLLTKGKDLKEILSIINNILQGE